MRFLRLPPLPQIPEPLQDRPLITLGACYAGPESKGAELVQPIRELGEPVMDTFQNMPPSGLPAVHMEPEEPVPGLVDTASLREAPQEAIDAFIETAGPDSGSPLLPQSFASAAVRSPSRRTEPGRCRTSTLSTCSAASACR